MARRSHFLLPVLLLAGCVARGPAVPEKAPGPIAMGRNAIGEECRALPVDGAEDQAYALYCGDWEQPSGTIAVTRLYDPLPEAAAARARQLALEANRTAWAGALAQKAICQPAQPVAGGLFSQCQLREGGWPYVGVTLADGRRMVQADGIPAVADLLLADRKSVV